MERSARLPAGHFEPVATFTPAAGGETYELLRVKGDPMVLFQGGGAPVCSVHLVAGTVVDPTRALITQRGEQQFQGIATRDRDPFGFVLTNLYAADINVFVTTTPKLEGPRVNEVNRLRPNASVTVRGDYSKGNHTLYLDAKAERVTVAENGRRAAERGEAPSGASTGCAWWCQSPTR